MRIPCLSWLLVSAAIVAAFAIWFVVQSVETASGAGPVWSYSHLIDAAENHEVAKVEIDGTSQTATATAKGGSRVEVNLGDSSGSAASQLQRDGVPVAYQPWTTTLLPEIFWGLVIGLLGGSALYLAIRVVHKGWRPWNLSPTAIVVLAYAACIGALAIVFWFSQQVFESGDSGMRWSQAELTSRAASGQVRAFVIHGTYGTAVGRDGSQHAVNLSASTSSTADQLTRDNVDVSYQQSNGGGPLVGSMLAGLLLAGGLAVGRLWRTGPRTTSSPSHRGSEYRARGGS